MLSPTNFILHLFPDSFSITIHRLLHLLSLLCNLSFGRLSKIEGRLRPSAYKKIKGRLRPSGYKDKLGVSSAYKIKGCKEEGFKVVC